MPSSTPISYLVDSILKRGMVNLVVGMSGTNKTTWTLQELFAIYSKMPFLGQFEPRIEFPRTHYVCIDRPTQQLEHKLQAFPLPADLFTYESYAHRIEEAADLFGIYARVPKGVKLLILDGVGLAMKRSIGQYDVACVMSRGLAWCQKHNATLIFHHHTPKAKGGQNYASPREKALGSGAWVQMAGLSIVLEQLNPFNIKDCRRTAVVIDNDAAPLADLALRTTQPDGVLEYDPDILQFDRNELQRMTGYPASTLDRHIAEWIKIGVFERTENGKFYGRLPI